MDFILKRKKLKKKKNIFKKLVNIYSRNKKKIKQYKHKQTTTFY